MAASPVRAFIPFLAVLSVALVGAAPLHAADISSATMPVRTNETHLARLIAGALAASPSFRLLVERLNDSDVVVYVRSVRDLPSGVDGHLTFMGLAGGKRYVVVSLAWGRPNLRLVSTLGHELQHAVEIADRREIVDHLSMVRAYEAFGSGGGWRANARTFDTQAAILAGERVWAEMLK